MPVIKKVKLEKHLYSKKLPQNIFQNHKYNGSNDNNQAKKAFIFNCNVYTYILLMIWDLKQHLLVIFICGHDDSHSSLCKNSKVSLETWPCSNLGNSTQPI